MRCFFFAIHFFLASNLTTCLLSYLSSKMVDFVCQENIKSLVENLATKHLCSTVEDIANPHVETFKLLRKTFEENSIKSAQTCHGSGAGGNDFYTNIAMNGNHHDGGGTGEGPLAMNGRGRSMLNKRALEDQVSNEPKTCIGQLSVWRLPSVSRVYQRKFQQENQDDSYFNDDDDDAIEQMNITRDEIEQMNTTADSAPAATHSEDRSSMSEEVKSLMEDVKSLDR